MIRYALVVIGCWLIASVGFAEATKAGGLSEPGIVVKVPSSLDAFEVPSLATLLERLIIPRDKPVHFCESQRNRLYKHAVQRCGYVELDEHQVMTKTITEPTPEVMSISDKRVTLQMGGRTRRVKLSRLGALGSYARALFALMNKDAQTIHRYFDVKISSGEAATPESWQIGLTQKRSRQPVQVTIQGHSGELVSIRYEVDEQQWQQMTFAAAHAE